MEFQKHRDGKGKYVRYLPKKIKTLPRCNNCACEFNRTGASQQYCKICQTIALECYECQNKIEKRRSTFDFHVKNNKDVKFYCSRKCYGLNRRKQETVKCKQCSIDFEAPIRSERKFCGRECYDVWQYNEEQRVCEWCDEPFMAWNNGTQRYCTKKCALSSNGETSIERKMREELERNDISFKQYVGIDSFYVDFLVGNTVVECDGIYWHSKPEVMERDERKNEVLKELGYKVFRFTDAEINDNVEQCVEAIKGN